MYKLTNYDFVLRLIDNAWIPKNTANTDYQAFLKYQAEGGRVYGADEVTQ